jgi:phosphatidylglycerophosphatase A
VNARRFVAAGFGVGSIPRRLWGSDNGAGTFGAALAAIIGVALLTLPWWTGALAAVAAVAVSVWASDPEARTETLEHADPGWVVIDEVAGTLVALVGLSGWPWVAALVVARLADIFKVLPGVGRAERWPGGWGITADDVVAGFYGLATGLVLTWLLA